jgi:hypothetical protein
MKINRKLLETGMVSNYTFDIGGYSEDKDVPQLSGAQPDDFKTNIPYPSSSSPKSVAARPKTSFDESVESPVKIDPVEQIKKVKKKKLITSDASVDPWKEVTEAFLNFLISKKYITEQMDEEDGIGDDGEDDHFLAGLNMAHSDTSKDLPWEKNLDFDEMSQQNPELNQPMDPNMIPQGMDPSMMGGQPPMQDPNAMQGMDPNMMQGQMGMDPSMMGGQPPMQPGMDPSMMQGQMGQDPNAMQGQPQMDPSMMQGQDPNAMQGQPPMDPSMMGGQPQMDPSMMQGQMGMDPNALGGQPPMGGSPAQMAGASYASDQKSAEEIGRIFELKKIYKRLLSMERYLSFTSDDVLNKLRKYVVSSIDMFETLVSNITAFDHSTIDSIIVTFYEFLETVYNMMNEYLDEKDEEKKAENNEDDEESCENDEFDNIEDMEKDTENILNQTKFSDKKSDITEKNVDLSEREKYINNLKERVKSIYLAESKVRYLHENTK